MDAETRDAETKGYTTNVALIRATRRIPCPEHLTQSDWHGKGLWRDDCPACQAMGVDVVDQVVGWDSTDPRCVGVTETGAAILISNPLRRVWWRLTHWRPQ